MATSNAPTQPGCPLGVSERTLSALRDDALSQTEAARLAAHVEGCPACRARLAAFDDLAALLRAERPPEPDERLWQAVSSAISATLRPTRLPGVAAMRSSWRQLAAVAAVLLLIASFATLFNLHRPGLPAQPAPTATPAPTLTPAPTATPQPTVTPVPLLPAHPLTWSAVSAPTSYQPVLFAADGESAYMCAGTDSGVLIWRTYDRGASWVPARQVPSEPGFMACQLVVDASDPSVAALAWAPRGSGGGDIYTGLMTTVDGGATWQEAPSQPFVHIDQLDSRGGVIYALRETADSSNSVVYHLWASSDRMRTWHQADHGLPSDVAGFWLQPNGSSILIVTSDGLPSSSSQMWLSPDGGATWRQLSVPGGLPFYRPARFAGFGAAPNGIVARWLQGQFHICVSNATLGTIGPSSPPQVTCSTDSGATWHARPLLPLTTQQSVSVSPNLIAIADDGAVLAYGLRSFYRLAAGSDRWQSLGAQPQTAQPGAFYCPSPGAGILWTLPDSTAGGPQYRIYIASYTP